MKIPEIQSELRAMAASPGDVDKARLAALAEELSRRRSNRAPAQSRPMTDEIRERIVQLRKTHPNMPLAHIAQEVGVNPGRVSETLNGFRE